ncbi:hypothetical protein DPEC_G00004620 [Dallia pectoralis]|uniref:Uncharacterized protein n=1 Tax=Dallia pectoralis TaxID=75939 RepID=A0ACC2HKJ6_DALPE|nr:hypothetical protein DPEC_G00004620 [Dallia pectoralis]
MASYYTTPYSDRDMGCVPSDFKMARVTPLLKKPSLDQSDVNNYRPVSLLSFLSKTLERVVTDQLSSYLSQNNLLDPNQSGFKTGHSTETALLCVTEALCKAQANCLSSVLILLDLSAAFDTVNHQILLSTLSDLGISGAVHSWFSSYLSDHFYQVVWRGSPSNMQPLVTGVPQGSVLGPLLFSLYTRSLGSVISSHGLSYHCYADDTQQFFSFPQSETQVASRISACLTDISAWMSAHHLKLNLGKTELLFFKGRACPLQDLSITVDNVTVPATHCGKNLGVTLDNSLSFSAHIKAVFRSHALQHSEICAIKPMQLIQNSAARLIFNLPKFSHVTQLFRTLHWLPVEARIHYKTMVLAYGAVRGTAPSYIQSLIKPYTPTRALRSATSGLLVVPSIREGNSRSAQPKLFSVLAPQWWNNSTLEIRSSDSTNLQKTSKNIPLQTVPPVAP